MGATLEEAGCSLVEGENFLLSLRSRSAWRAESLKQNSTSLATRIFYMFSCLLVAIFILSTAKAVFEWPLGSTQMLFAIFTPIIILLSFKTINFRKIPVIQCTLASAIVFVYVLILAPIRQFDSESLSFLMPLTIAPIILMQPRYIRGVLDTIALIVGLSSLSALIVFLANLVGLDLPWIRLEQDFRFNASHYYRLYPGSVVLSTQIWDMGSITVLRTSGLFREPGHMAMLCAGIIVANGMDLSRWRYKLTFVGGLLTMSPPFFGLVVVLFVVNSFETWSEARRMLTAIIFLTLLVAGFVLFAPDAVYERILGANLSFFLQGGLYEILNERTRGSFHESYASLNFSEMLFGIGIGAFASSGFADTAVSDFRGFIVRFGIVSLVALASLIFYLGHLADSKRQLVIFVAFFFIVALHRSWMMTSMWFPLLLAFGVILARDKNASVSRSV